MHCLLFIYAEPYRPLLCLFAQGHFRQHNVNFLPGAPFPCTIMSCCPVGLAAVLSQEAAEHPSPSSRGGNELVLCLSVVARAKATAQDLSHAQLSVFLRSDMGRGDSGKAVCRGKKWTVGQFGNTEGSIANCTARVNAFNQ